jgi:hypothetical protein
VGAEQPRPVAAPRADPSQGLALLAAPATVAAVAAADPRRLQGRRRSPPREHRTAAASPMWAARRGTTAPRAAPRSRPRQPRRVRPPRCARPPPLRLPPPRPVAGERARQEQQVRRPKQRKWRCCCEHPVRRLAQGASRELHGPDAHAADHLHGGPGAAVRGHERPALAVRPRIRADPRRRHRRHRGPHPRAAPGAVAGGRLHLPGGPPDFLVGFPLQGSYRTCPTSPAPCVSTPDRPSGSSPPRSPSSRTRTLAGGPSPGACSTRGWRPWTPR